MKKNDRLINKPKFCIHCCKNILNEPFCETCNNHHFLKNIKINKSENI